MSVDVLIRESGDVALIEMAIAASGLSARQFAMRIARVNERTVRRWLAGTSTIRDKTQRARILRYVREHPIP